MKRIVEAIDSLIRLHIHQATRYDNLTDGQAIEQQKAALTKLLEVACASKSRNIKGKNVPKRRESKKRDSAFGGAVNRD